MNKSQLIEALAKHENLTLKKAEMAVNAIFENIVEALVRNERVELRGFGSFWSGLQLYWTPIWVR